MSRGSPKKEKREGPKRGKPVAELRPPAADPKPRFGEDKGRIAIRDDFDDPLPGMEPYR